jgi:hypothetical protein
MSKWTTRGLFVGGTMLLATAAFTYEFGPPANSTGAQRSATSKEQTCNTGGCHTGNTLNAAGGSVTLFNAPDSYVPGQKYTMQVQVAKPGQSRWGFELTAKKADFTRGGELLATDTDNTQVIPSDNPRPSETSPEYLEHTEPGTAWHQEDTGPMWTFDWVAPAAGSGPVTFYVAGNAANGNNTNGGDFIYTTSKTIAEGSATPEVVFGDINGDNKVNVQDATLALRIAVKLTTVTDAQIKAGDVAPKHADGTFGDGKVNVSDATRILRFAVGIETSF